MTAATEPVLRGLQDAATFEVLVLLFYAKVHHGVDHVLELVGTSHLAGLVDLADDDRVAVMLLAVISDEGQGPLSRLAVGVTVLVEPVVHALEAVNDQEEGLPGIGLAKLGSILQQCGNVSLLASDEALAELQAFDNQLDLEEGFLSSVEQCHPTGAGDGICQGQHHGSLTRARGTRKEGYRSRREALPTQGAVDVIEAGLVLVAKLLGNLDIEDVDSDFDIVSAYVKFHLAFSLVWSFAGGDPFPTIKYIIQYLGCFCTCLSIILHESYGRNTNSSNLSLAWCQCAGHRGGED